MPNRAAETKMHSGSTPQPTNAKIEALLLHLFPSKLLMDAIASFTAHTGDKSDGTQNPEFNARVEAQRQKLRALPSAEIDRLYLQMLEKQKTQAEAAAKEREAKKTAKTAAKEAGRFYNQSNAQADFDYWTKAEYWTFDESIALLLGKEPTVATWPRVKREMESERGLFFAAEKPILGSGFLRDYERLRNLAGRSSVMRSTSLKPLDAIEWARKANIVELPAPLLRQISTSNLASQTLEVPVNALPQCSHNSHQTETSGNPTVKWTAAKLSELRGYRERHGTKAAANHYGISDARIRQLLPKESPQPSNNNPFNLGRR